MEWHFTSITDHFIIIAFTNGEFFFSTSWSWTQTKVNKCQFDMGEELVKVGGVSRCWRNWWRWEGLLEVGGIGRGERSYRRWTDFLINFPKEIIKLGICLSIEMSGFREPIVWLAIFANLILYFSGDKRSGSIRAHRKFASGSLPKSLDTTPSKSSRNAPDLRRIVSNKPAKTEDFLTFLCLRSEFEICLNYFCAEM